jgi:hypothetical protein
MFLRLAMLGLAVASVGLTGCAEIQELKINTRNRYLAKEAWESLRETSECMNFEADFGRGFRAGYYDVANGGNGCPPPLPPERYWSVRYMSIEGRERTEAWFAGFRYGAMVAQQDGIGVFLELPTSQPDESTRRVIPLPTKEQIENAENTDEAPSAETAVPAETDSPVPTESSTETATEPADTKSTSPASTSPTSPNTAPPADGELDGSSDRSLPPLDAPLLPEKQTIPGTNGAKASPGTPSTLNPTNPNK